MSSYFHRNWHSNNYYQDTLENIMKTTKSVVRHVPRQVPSFEQTFEEFEDEVLEAGTVDLPECPIASEVMRKVGSRAEEGMKTYGKTLADNPLPTDQWIDHTIEELLDAANYLTRLKQSLHLPE